MKVKVTDLSLAQLTTAYNAYPHKGPVKKFADKTTAQKRVRDAFQAVDRLLVKNDEIILEPATAQALGLEVPGEDLALVEASKKTPPDPNSLIRGETKGGAGRGRLNADPEKAELLRRAVVADQAAAAALAAQRPTKPAATKGRDGAPPANTGSTPPVAPKSRRGASFTDEQKLSRVAANPKKPGKANHARYAQYKVGMTVGEVRAALGKHALPDLTFDVKHGFVDIE